MLNRESNNKTWTMILFDFIYILKNHYFTQLKPSEDDIFKDLIFSLLKISRK